jgi:hypothetical protein
VDKDAKENGGIEKTASASSIEPSAPGAAWMNDLDLLHQCLQFCKMSHLFLCSSMCGVCGTGASFSSVIDLRAVVPKLDRFNARRGCLAKLIMDNG